MIVVGDIVEIVGDVRLSEYECLSFWHREVRPIKEHKVLEILRTWRDSRSETE